MQRHKAFYTTSMADNACNINGDRLIEQRLIEQWLIEQRLIELWLIEQPAD